MSYTETRNIDSKENQAKTFRYTECAEKLNEKYEYPIMVEKKIFQLSTLRDIFVVIATEEGIGYNESYRSSYVKKRLSGVWPELSFIYQRGLSDVDCASDITVGEALRTAEKFNQAVKEISEDFADESQNMCIETNNVKMHKAIGILRQRISENTKDVENEYYAASEMTLSAQKAFVDPIL